MWYAFFKRMKYQDTYTSVENMIRRIIHSENLRYRYISTFSTSTYPCRRSSKLLKELIPWSLVKPCESINQRIYHIDGLNKDKAMKDGSTIDVDKIINLNMKDQEDTPIPPASLVSSYGKAQEIFNLDESNFESELKKYKFTLVMFHAPWCQFCKVMKEIFYQLSQEIPSDVARLAMLDGEEYPTAALDNDVHVFPTFKLYRRDKLVKTYDGSNQYSDLLEFVRSNTIEKS